ncbi:RNA methyltransferase [Aurantibacillus circumpalustris]|uniref:RNA methyltransferase n=1 Tax=Aurantibacillus circumpalustris TaxID=3036359 RepID=UPI00295C0BC7|nr:RNA methyltransferase [Aurantibacillus circumpalustris]
MSEKLKNEELNRLSVEAFKSAKKQSVIIVLDNVRSLNNVGSAFRTADAFLIEEILLCGVTGTPPNKEIEKTALGATSTVKWVHFKTTLEAIIYLKEKAYTPYAVEQAKNSIALNSFVYNDEKIALVFGNEVYGVEQTVIDACKGVIEIPQIGSKHSFNISVSIGIVLWELLRGKL